MYVQGILHIQTYRTLHDKSIFSTLILTCTPIQGYKTQKGIGTGIIGAHIKNNVVFSTFVDFGLPTPISLDAHMKFIERRWDIAT